MKKFMVIVAALAAIAILGFAASTQAGPPCCIAGKYKTTFKDKPAPPCESPGIHHCTFIFYQNHCQPQVRAKLLDENQQLILYVSGTLTPAGNGCKFEGTGQCPPGTFCEGETVKIRAKFYKVNGIWNIGGRYYNPQGCSGTFHGTHM
ncbi:MAG: hypothetical protein DRG40_00905 [Deltaproteobacteria bacterium]|nr:MAG: hypothetical protein DRG40_00905 [Deltaproteobacteria bacterium]